MRHPPTQDLPGWEAVLWPVTEFPWSLSRLSRPHRCILWRKLTHIIFYFLGACSAPLYIPWGSTIGTWLLSISPVEGTRAMLPRISFYGGIVGTQFWKYRVIRRIKRRTINCILRRTKKQIRCCNLSQTESGASSRKRRHRLTIRGKWKEKEINKLRWVQSKRLKMMAIWVALKSKYISIRPVGHAWINLI